ncbi:DUF3499 domain-containing protein [Janibacter sp. G1551]|uniref:DUF3499 domain-containing protein n=1 Tax=Janibacter sp. G1551 TaxID=3420440 RepID=UPI003CFCED61
MYSDSTVVLGPLATYAEPHSYDLCADHSSRMTAPRGWEVVRLSGDQTPPDSHDDLVALANVVRAAKAAEGTPSAAAAPAAPVPLAALPRRAGTEPGSVRETGRRGHLRMLQDESE